MRGSSVPATKASSPTPKLGLWLPDKGLLQRAAENITHLMTSGREKEFFSFGSGKFSVFSHAETTPE